MAWRDERESAYSLETPFLDEEAIVFETGPVEERDDPAPPPAGTTVQFPSGEKLPITTGPDGRGAEFHDPYLSGMPLLDVSGKNRLKKVSAHFTAGEFATSGGVPFTKARIDPALVECVEALRVFVKSSITILNGYYSWKFVGPSKTPPAVTPHMSGRAAKLGSRTLNSVELAKAAVFACPDATSIAIGPASITVAVNQSKATITAHIDNGEKNDRALSLIRTYRDLVSTIPPEARDAAASDQDIEGLKKMAHWAIHAKGVRDPEILFDLLFYRTGYVAIVRSHHKMAGRFDGKSMNRKSMDWSLRTEILDKIVKPALADVKAPPAQRGGEPGSPKDQMRDADPQPETPGFDLTGRYEAIHKDQSIELGKTMCINQAGEHIEIYMSNVLAPGAAAAARDVQRLYGDLDGKGFRVFDRLTHDRLFQITPTSYGLNFIRRASGIVEKFTRVSDSPMILENAAVMIKVDEKDRNDPKVQQHLRDQIALQEFLAAWEWMPLLSTQVKNLKDAFSDERFIGGYLELFFDAKGDWEHWLENIQVKAVETFGKGIAARVFDRKVGVHKFDWPLALFYIRQYLTGLQWRPYKNYPFLSGLEWAQRLVAVVENQSKNHSGKTGYADPGPLVGPLVTLMGLRRDTATDEKLHQYRVTMTLTGGALVAGGFKASLTVEKLDAQKWQGGTESFTAVIGVLGLSLKWKLGKLPEIGYMARWKDKHVGYAESAFYWYPNDFPGQISIALGEAAGSVGVKAEAAGGFMHVHGRGGLPVLQVIFSDSDVGLALSRKMKLGLTIFQGFGTIRNRDFKEVVYPKEFDKTDYGIIYKLATQTHFPFDSAFLTREGRQAIRVFCANELVALLTPSSLLEIKAHTDSMGTPEHNSKLSRFRAENTHKAIKDVLGRKLACRVTAKGFGEDEAAKAGEKEKRNLDFRRVDIILNGVVVLRLWEKDSK
jgi:flagellar motor protein MotB